MTDDGLELDLQEAAEAEEDVLACLCPGDLGYGYLVGHYSDCPQAGTPRNARAAEYLSLSTADAEFLLDPNGPKRET